MNLSPQTAQARALPFSMLMADLLDAGFRGDIDADAASRAAMSTDNSVYQITPDLIVSPLDSADVALLVKTMAQPQYAAIAMTARGGGTGTNGQALNSGVIIDFRRHMHRLIEVNAGRGWADVEPGMVLDELNDILAPSGLFFAPNTSTSSRCTIGGMVSTDASGKGSRIYGKTSDNILGLQVVTGDGTVLDSLSPSPQAPQLLLDRIASACDAGREALLATVPRLSRRFSGYDLERARPDAQTLQWWRLFIGAEGTLGLVTKIRVKLVRKPKFNRLAVVAYDSFEQALSASRALLASEPLAIESLDEWVQRLADEAGLLEDLPKAIRGGNGQRPVYNFVEFAGDDEARLQHQVDDLIAGLPDTPGVVGYHLSGDARETARLWSIRSASVGLLGNSQTSRTPIPFVEDCVVPPENLAAFVTEFGGLLRQEGLAYGIYGHADVGCLHVRPALDMGDQADIARLKRVSDAVYAMVKRYGGIFWGEHGKGVRGEYLRDFVGPVAFDAFIQIKAAFDPAERLNPGKLVTLQAPLKGIATTPLRVGQSVANGLMSKAFSCNGNALCLNYAKTSPMCPSFKVTNDVRHSPKGRAEALKAWNNAVETGSPDVAAIEADTFEALDGCLGCKACASACPVHVDIPEMKSHFLERYYTTHRRRLSDLAGIWLERLAPQLATIRPALRLAHALGLQQRIAGLLGLVDTPAATARGLRALGYPVVNASQVSRRQWPEVTVLVAIDAFTLLFDTDAIADICDGLAALGYGPAILSLPAAGKAAHVKGDRAGFLRQARRLKNALDLAGGSDLPIVGVDPAFVLMLRSEYRHAGLSPARPVQLVQEFLLSALKAGATWSRPARALPPTKMLMHCTETSSKPTAGQDWNQIFAHLGLPVSVAATGCCGMAGLYGHERAHQASSRQLFDMSWKSAVADAPIVFATGFSCRCQSERLASKPAAHPLRLIAQAMAPA